MALNKQQELFCQGLFEGLSQRQAYLAAFPQATKNNWKPKTIDNRAYELANSGEIVGRLEQIKGENAANAQLSRQGILEWLEKIMKTSGVKFKGSDVIKAAELYIKMCGYEAPQEILSVSADTAQTLASITKLLNGGGDTE